MACSWPIHLDIWFKGLQERIRDILERIQKNISNIKQLSDSLNIKFEIFLSPILYDIDSLNAHPF